MFRMHIPEGFEGQIHYVIPRHFLQTVEHYPLLHALFPTDIGWYPAARYHYRERPLGAPEHILIYCVAGSGWATLRQQTIAIPAGHALIIPSSEPHIYGASLHDPWTIHWLHFRGETAYQFVQHMQPGDYVLPVHEKAHAPIVETFQECYEALANGFTMRQMIFCALTIQRLLAWLFFANPAFQSEASPLPRTIERTLAYLRDHVDQRLSLAEMAQQADLSVSHFSYLFRLHMGVSPVDYFIHLKMQYACYLLETTRMPIRDVALSLSYEDPYYFSRLFRKVIGVSPQRYRQQPLSSA